MAFVVSNFWSDAVAALLVNNAFGALWLWTFETVQVFAVVELAVNVEGIEVPVNCSSNNVNGVK